jgi:hypothetical protein
VRRRFSERGLRGCVERKRPARDYATKLDGAQEARLIQLACTEAPQGHAQWSLRLLAGRLVELGVVDTISYETVPQTLKKTPSSLTSGGNGWFLPNTMRSSWPRWKTCSMSTIAHTTRCAPWCAWTRCRVSF